MKKTFFIMFIVAVAAMMFAACGKDESEPNNNNGNNVGGGSNAEVSGSTWVGYQGNPQSDDSYATYTLTFCNDTGCAMSIAFYAASEGGNYATTHFEGIYTVSGNGGTMTLTDDILHEEYNDTFAIDGDVLTLTHGRVSITMAKGNGDTPPAPNPEVTTNCLVVGTQQYQLHPTLSITGEGVYLIGANDPNGVYDIIADIPSTLLGQTIDLAQTSTADRFYINLQTASLSFALQTGDQPINTINGEEVGSVFEQGTLQFSKESGVIVLRVSGTLADGTFVGFMMCVAEADIEAMDNQMIVDGHIYPADPVVWHRSGANLSYEMRLFAQEDGNVSVGVEIEPTAFNNDISLTTTTTAFRYRVTVSFWDQDTTATQDAFTGTVESSYWDIEAQTDYPQEGCLFTSGILNAIEDEYAVGFSIKGSMTNGRTISARLRVDKSEIQEQ